MHSVALQTAGFDVFPRKNKICLTMRVIGITIPFLSVEQNISPMNDIKQMETVVVGMWYVWQTIYAPPPAIPRQASLRSR